MALTIPDMASVISVERYSKLLAKLTSQEVKLRSVSETNRCHANKLDEERDRCEHLQHELSKASAPFEQYLRQLFAGSSTAELHFVNASPTWDDRQLSAIRRNIAEMREILETGDAGDLEVDSGGVAPPALSHLDLLPQSALCRAEVKTAVKKEERTAEEEVPLPANTVSWDVFNDLVRQNLYLKEHIQAMTASTKGSHRDVNDYEEMILLLKADRDDFRAELCRVKDKNKKEVANLKNESLKMMRSLQAKSILLDCYHQEYGKLREKIRQLEGCKAAGSGVQPTHQSTAQPPESPASNACGGASWEVVFTNSQQQPSAETLFVDGGGRLGEAETAPPSVASREGLLGTPAARSEVGAAPPVAGLPAADVGGLQCERCLRQFEGGERDEYNKHVTRCSDD